MRALLAVLVRTAYESAGKDARRHQQDAEQEVIGCLGKVAVVVSRCRLHQTEHKPKSNLNSEGYIHQLRILSGAANRMRNFHLSRAWEKWQWWYEGAKPLEPKSKEIRSKTKNLA